MNSSLRPRFRESAAVVLVRGAGESLETFWVRRSDEVPFMPGFHAFLGGKVDAQDAELEVRGTASEFESAARACAIRETFEEAGVLVGLEGNATPHDGAPRFAGVEPAGPRPAGLAAARDELLAGRVTFPELARAHDWRFSAEALLPAGSWTTPPFASQRFDACYYLARLPEGQNPIILPGELASGEWVRPMDALARYRAGEAVFAAPILWTLIALAEGEAGLAERLANGPERSIQPVPRVELTWGIVLHAMPTRPLPPATHTNAYLIGEKDMVILDPGSGDAGALAQLFGLIDHLATEGRKLRMVLVSHHHSDHWGGVEAVRARYKVPVAAHALTGEHVRIDVALSDGERIPLSPGLREWNLRVIHTPGHSRDHLCFLHEASDSLFCGDLIAGAGTVVIDPPDGDMGDYLKSLERLIALKPRLLLPAHGSPNGAPAGRLRGLVAHRLQREARVLAALDATGRPLADLVPAVYADVKPELWPYAERSLLAHLLKLESDGRAIRKGERWGKA
ncbi:MAG: MBL fold metallo-hydrolase [Candidatus Eisenbacteria bacterium]